MQAKLYRPLLGIALCATLFSIGFMYQFGAFLRGFALCEHTLVDLLFSCVNYPDIKLMILSVIAGVALLSRIAYLLKALRGAAIVVTVLYSVLLFRSIVFKPFGHAVAGSGNFVPFKTILPYLSGSPTWTVALNNLAGNFVPFMLLGLLLPLTTKQPLKGVGILGLSLTIGAVMEITQAAFRLGIFDIDDILLNALGVAVGYLLTTTITSYIKKFDQQTQ